MAPDLGPWLTLLGILLGGGSGGYLIKGWLERRGQAAKAAVDEATADATRLNNNLAPLERVIVVLQQQLNHMQAELEGLRDNYQTTQEQLDAATDRIALLRQENRAWADYHLDVTRYLKTVAAGQTNSEPPEPPHPRTEFTRRSDQRRPPSTGQAK